MKIKEKHIRLLGIPILALVIPFVFPKENYWELVVICLVYTSIYWQGGWMIVEWMRKKYPSYEQTPKRILMQSICVVALITFTTPLCEYVFMKPSGFDKYLRSWLISLIVTFVVISIYECVYFFEMWKKTVIEVESIKREHIISQYETLKNQVNPHFLFNSFNTLATIIHEDQNLAVEFVEKLSNVYRYVLQNKDKELVSLTEELGFARAYLFLHQIRFGQNLNVHITIEDSYLSSSLAPLSLQLLLENAIKHNVISSAKPLHIYIYIENDSIVVKNNLQKKSTLESSTQIGLDNIVNRYHYLTNRKVDILSTATNFIVALPLLYLESH